MSSTSSTRCIALVLAGVVGAILAEAAFAADGDADPERPDAMVVQPGKLTRSDTQNVQVPSQPGYRTDLTSLNYQRWASNGRAEVGVGVGSVSLVDRPTGAVPGRALDASGVNAASGTTMMLGLRYRTTESASFYANASRIQGLGLANDDQRVVGKVGVEFKAAQSQWNIAYGGLGFKMAGDSKMTVKVRRNGIGIFMRSTF